MTDKGHAPKPRTISEILALAPVVPVLVIDRTEHAVPLARALVEGGLKALEVTLRTRVALDALERISAEVPDALVGAGTVLSPSDAEAAMRVGARFGVSPGLTDALAFSARDHAWPLLPGAVTSSEIMHAIGLGFDHLKLFPAAEVGGPGLLKALAGPFPHLRFCPTGGITAETASDYLALPNVAAVGGSWVAPARLLAVGDWPAVTELARRAAALPRKGN
ncbi:MAG: bifunctional 4-hydroxy-2-oxoglutarate aldolase/2-dehydro-3-deoxy-phosphogluconate aldolase [Hyphomicrobiaceae bacterium]